MIRKILFVLGLSCIIWFSNISITQAETPTRWFWLNNENVSEFDTLWTVDTQGGELIDVIKTFINWALWMLSLIALVIILYAWFKMVTAAGDETKYKDGFKIIQQAAVWLAVIGLSWFIVSIIFWIIVESGWGWQTTE